METNFHKDLADQDCIEEEYFGTQGGARCCLPSHRSALEEEEETRESELAKQTNGKKSKEKNKKKERLREKNKEAKREKEELALMCAEDLASRKLEDAVKERNKPAVKL